jgi:hypothetical protein
MASAMSAKSISGTLMDANRNAAPQCVLLLMKESGWTKGLIEAHHSHARRWCSSKKCFQASILIECWSVNPRTSSNHFPMFSLTSG